MPRVVVDIGESPNDSTKKKRRKHAVATGAAAAGASSAPSSLIAQQENGLDVQALATAPVPLSAKNGTPESKAKAPAPAPERIPFKTTQRRLSSGWLQAYLQYTSGQESPSKFHFFAGLSILAGAVRRHIFLDRGYYTLYPNIYVVLVAGSAICRKSTACNIAIDFLYNLEQKHIFHGQASMQGLLDFMANMKHHYCAGKKTQDSSAFVYSDELHVLLSGRSYTEDLIKIFTDFYSGKKEWDYKLKETVLTVRNCSPSILAASTPVWLAKALPPELMEAGLTGRMFFVYENRGKRIAHPKPPSTKLKDALQHDLQHISNLEGEFFWEEEAKDAFATWYESLDMNYDQDILASYYARKPDHALKLAMLFSVNESDDLRITLRHWTRALQCLDEVEVNARHAYQYMGTNEAALAGEILSTLKILNGVELKSEVFRRVGHRYKTTRQFDEIVDSLVLQKRVKRIKLKTNNKSLLFAEKFENTIAQAEKFTTISKMQRVINEKDPDTL